MSEQRYQPDEADKIVRDYVCAQCWGQLVGHYDWRNRVTEVECPNCGIDRGLVSKKWVEEKKAEDAYLAAEAEANLSDMLGKPKKTKEQIMKELGF